MTSSVPQTPPAHLVHPHHHAHLHHASTFAAALLPPASTSSSSEEDDLEPTEGRRRAAGQRAAFSRVLRYSTRSRRNSQPQQHSSNSNNNSSSNTSKAKTAADVVAAAAAAAAQATTTATTTTGTPSLKRQLSDPIPPQDSSSTSTSTCSVSMAPPPVKRARPALDATTLEMLECPVCIQIPRSTTLFTCQNGHPICGKCHEKLSKSAGGGALALSPAGKAGSSGSCPTCRSDAGFQRNPFAERLLQKTLDTVELSCQFESQGCAKSGVGSDLLDHESQCMYRMVACPSGHRGVCSWEGTWEKSLFKHLYKNQKCIQVIRPLIPGATFRSNIVDYSDKAQSVFDSPNGSNWLPMVLVTKVDALYECIYLLISRQKDGTWFIVPRTYAPPKVRSRMRVTITLYPAGENPDDGCVSYRGLMNSNSDSEEEVRSRGRFIAVSDCVVKAMRRNKSIFEYSASLSVTQNEEGEGTKSDSKTKEDSSSSSTNDNNKEEESNDSSLNQISSENRKRNANSNNNNNGVAEKRQRKESVNSVGGGSSTTSQAGSSEEEEEEDVSRN